MYKQMVQSQTRLHQKMLGTVKFLNFRTQKLCCNSPKIQTKGPNLKVFCPKHANGIANSEDPDQTAPREDQDQTTPLGTV